MKHYRPPVIPLVPPKLYSRLAWAAKLALTRKPRPKPAQQPAETALDCAVDPQRMAPGTLFTVSGVGPDEYGDLVVNGVCNDGTPSTPARLQLWRAVAPEINSKPAAEMPGATEGTT